MHFRWFVIGFGFVFGFGCLILGFLLLDLGFVYGMDFVGLFLGFEVVWVLWFGF